VIVVVWVHALRREQRKLDAFVPGLQKQAQDAARTLETRRTNDAWEVQQLEQRLAELKAGLQALVGGPERAQSFEPFADGKLRCPRCWVRRGALVQLIPNRAEHPGMVRCDAPGCGLREKVT
jgi:acyl transferase domain-containing protein